MRISVPSKLEAGKYIEDDDLLQHFNGASFERPKHKWNGRKPVQSYRAQQGINRAIRGNTTVLLLEINSRRPIISQSKSPIIS